VDTGHEYLLCHGSLLFYGKTNIVFEVDLPSQMSATVQELQIMQMGIEQSMD
jgi:hypothetical protein